MAKYKVKVGDHIRRGGLVHRVNGVAEAWWNHHILEPREYTTTCKTGWTNTRGVRLTSNPVTCLECLADLKEHGC